MHPENVRPEKVIEWPEKYEQKMEELQRFGPPVDRKQLGARLTANLVQ